MRTSALLLPIFAAALSGYAFAQSIPISGDSNAPPRIKAQATAIVEIVAKKVASCQNIESIHVQIVRAGCGPNANNCDDLPEWTTERWTANLCGQDIPFLVAFALDGKVKVPPVVSLENKN
jgi:hypothetical protein